MQKLTAILGVAVLGAACGGKKDEGKAKPTAPAPTTGSAATGPVTPPTPPAPPPPPAKPAIILPAAVTVDKPVSVAEMAAIAAQWPDKGEFTFVGYPAFFMGEADKLRTGLELAPIAEQKSTAATVRCDLAASETGKEVDNKTPVTVRGKLRGRWGKENNQMWFEECTLVASGAPADAEAMPKAGDPTPVALTTLFDAYMGWFGKEVQVTGYYFGRTISRKSPTDQTMIDFRLDLIQTAGEMKPKVGCHLELVEPTPEFDAKLDGARAAVTVRGKIDKIIWDGEAQLEPCAVANPM